MAIADQVLSLADDFVLGSVTAAFTTASLIDKALDLGSDYDNTVQSTDRLLPLPKGTRVLTAGGGEGMQVNIHVHGSIAAADNNNFFFILFNSHSIDGNGDITSYNPIALAKYNIAELKRTNGIVSFGIPNNTPLDRYLQLGIYASHVVPAETASVSAYLNDDKTYWKAMPEGRN